MVFINETQTTWVILGGLTTNVTGNLFITLLIVVMLLVFVALALRIPPEATAIIVLPLLIVTMAYYEVFLGVGLILMIYIGYLVARNLGVGQR